jgi:valyl-tRNA synthetase
MRNLKAEYNVATRKDVKFLVIKASDWLLAETDVLGLLAGGDIEVLDIYDAPKGTPAAVTDVGEIYMPLDGLIDMQAEKSRLDKEIAKVAQEVIKCEAKLGNSAFVDKAPTELVDREKSRLDEWAQKHSQLQEMRSSLG